MLGQAISIERFDDLDEACVESAPPLVEHASVGHLVGQRVHERVFQVGEETHLIQELGRLEMGEPSAQLLLTLLDDRRQQGEGHVFANDRCGLEQALVLRRKSVDPGG
jgi:hypothetical protein